MRECKRMFTALTLLYGFLPCASIANEAPQSMIIETNTPLKHLESQKKEQASHPQMAEIDVNLLLQQLETLEGKQALAKQFREELSKENLNKNEKIAVISAIFAALGARDETEEAYPKGEVTDTPQASIVEYYEPSYDSGTYYREPYYDYGGYGYGYPYYGGLVFLPGIGYRQRYHRHHRQRHGGHHKPDHPGRPGRPGKPGKQPGRPGRPGSRPSRPTTQRIRLRTGGHVSRGMRPSYGRGRQLSGYRGGSGMQRGGGMRGGSGGRRGGGSMRGGAGRGGGRRR